MKNIVWVMQLGPHLVCVCGHSLGVEQASVFPDPEENEEYNGISTCLLVCAPAP